MLDEPTDSNDTATTDAPAAEAPAKAPRRRRATKAAAPAAESPAAESLAAASPAAEPAADAAAADSARAELAAEGAAAPAAAEAEDKPAPAKRVRKAPAKKAAPRKRAAAAAKTPLVEEDEEAAALALAAETAAAETAAAEALAASTAAADVTPAEETPAPAKRTRARRAPAATVTFQPPPSMDDEPVVAPAGDAQDSDEAPAPRRRRRAGTAGAVSPSELVPALLEPTPAPASTTGPDDADGDDDEDDPDRPRRRRRGRRGRGGRRPEEGDETETTEASTDTPSDSEPKTDGDDAESDDDEDGESASGTRRRRRRRRSGSGTGAGSSDGDDDTPASEPRTRSRSRSGGGGSGGGGGGGNGATSADEDGVRGITGSTRMAAKRVRRQEGRDSGRKRAPILSEAEFLARREAVERTMVVRQQGDRTQIAVLEDGVLVEHYVTKASAQSYAGNVYLGRVQNVLPSMEAAFVDIGKGRNAVLYAGEVNYDGAGRSRSIESVLKSGQEVLVQVSKDPIGHKGARLTGQVSLPGRYLVYVPEGSMTGISRKLPEGERDRLKKILKKVVPDDAGVIIRTAAEGASEEEIAGDVRRLQAQWEVIQTKAAKGGASVLLHAEPDLLIRVVRDVFNEDFASLVVQGDTEWDTIRDYVEFVAPDLAPRLSRHTADVDVFAAHRIDEQLAKALDRKVWLPSGGSLVIDRTEAMIVVDVNTGKYVGKGGNLEETVTRNNLEAAEEIARQLRLRDLGGIIVVDFIDMVLESNRDLVVRRLVECLGRDRTKHQVAEVTSLGLVQMTRKRVGQGLLESFSEQCEACNGRGVLVQSEPVDEKRNGGGGGEERERSGRDGREGRERGERGGRGGKGKADKGEKAEKPDKAEKSGKDEKPGRAEKPGKDEMPGRDQRPVEDQPVSDLPVEPTLEPARPSMSPTIEERPAATTPRRRRGGRGAGAASVDKAEAPATAPEPAEADADDALVTSTVEPDASVDEAPLAVEPPSASNPQSEPAADEAPAPKRRRRATSRPAGPPAAD